MGSTTAIEVRERPILFRSEMVRAILDGRKTQTRRIPGPTNSTVDGHTGNAKRFSALNFNASNLGVDKSYTCGCIKYVPCSLDDDPTCGHRVRSVYDPGTRLWVRESWWVVERAGQGIGNQFVIFDDEWIKGPPEVPDESAPLRPVFGKQWGHRPSTFMFRAHARTLLEITDVRAERLQSISEEDARAEGVDPWPFNPQQTITTGEPGSASPYRGGFAVLWDEIHDVATWKSNPWVWAITFRKIDQLTREES